MNTGDYQWVPLPGPDVEIDARFPPHRADQFCIIYCKIEACFNASPMMIRYVDEVGQVHKCTFVTRHLRLVPKWIDVPKPYQDSIENEFSKFMADFVVVSVPIYDKDGRIVG